MIFIRKVTNNSTPYSIPSLSVLHRNKALYSFRKRGQRSTVERNLGLEYVLLVTSNSHISTTLHISPTLKKRNWLKKLCTGSTNGHVLRSSEVIFSGKISFFYFLACGSEISNRRKCVFFRSLDPHKSRLFHKKNCFTITKAVHSGKLPFNATFELIVSYIFTL